jgi:UDP-glucose 4-epimerase
MSTQTEVKKVLVTGATGFIGLRLLELLKKNDCNVRILSRNPYPGYESILCDFEKEKISPSALESVDTIFHIAGFAHDFRNNSKVESIYQKVNVNATIQLAKLAIKNDVKRFVFLSSVKAGGKPFSAKCMIESDQFEPESIYGKSKREAEIKLLELTCDSDMHVVIVRPALVYGPGMKGNLKLMLSGIKKGWFPPLPDIDNQRSMIHVDDLVQALMIVAQDKRANGEIFIATDGKPYSSREIYVSMCNVLGKPVPKWHIPVLLFDIAAKLNIKIRYKINKLLENEWYSSEKLESIGFKAKKSIRQMHEHETFI